MVQPSTIIPQTIFIKDGFTSYFVKLFWQRQIVKTPVYVICADSRFPYASRSNPKHDCYHFNDSKERAICIDGNVDKSLMASGDVEQFLDDIQRKPIGLIVAEDDNCKAALALTGQHDVMLILSDMTSIQEELNNHALDIHHYYTFIDHKRGIIRHLFCSMNFNKHDSILFPLDSTERTRIMRKVTTHEKSFTAMSKTEAFIVGSGGIGAILNKF